MAVLKSLVLAALVASVSAFTGSVPVVGKSSPVARHQGNLRMGVESMEGVGPETGGRVFDPLGFSKIASDETMAWFRACEIKHGRVAMAATTGYALTASGVRFPGMLSQAEGVSFASLKTATAWDAMPDAGKWQILGVIGILELVGEAQKPHYTQGGKIGALPWWDPLKFTAKLSEEQKAKKRVSELKNGRLAMIAIMASVAGASIPGSVPLLPNVYPY